MKEGKGSRMLKGYTSKQIARAEGDLKRGFRTTGLWAWSRHPVCANAYHRLFQLTGR